jgi:hypothetical protein
MIHPSNKVNKHQWAKCVLLSLFILLYAWRSAVIKLCNVCFLLTLACSKLPADFIYCYHRGAPLQATLNKIFPISHWDKY